MLNYLRALRLKVVDFFTPGTGALLDSLCFLEARIEAAIAKDLRKGERLAEDARITDFDIRMNNRNLDAAYKLIHSLSEVPR
jgi:hypothetical protein